MKPQKILDLENELGFELEEMENSGNIRVLMLPKSYIINDKQEVIGLCVSESKIVDISFLVKLHNLQLLDLNNNQIDDISPLQCLKNLKMLLLDGNQIQKFDTLLDLSDLEDLDLSGNQIKDISSLKGTNNLVSLNLCNNQIQYISLDFINNSPELTKLYLFGNPIKDIPKEIFGRNDNFNCLPALKAYFQDGEKYGWDENQDLKLTLIGNGRVGKTSLVRRLVEDKFDKEYQSTHGIQLRQYTDLQPYNINIWDFGGQDIYHTTHRLFMQTRALFLVVWDWETEQEPTQKIKENNRVNEYQNYDLDYWLNYVKILGKGSRVIVVQTKSQEKNGNLRHKQENELKQKYKDIWLDTISVDSKVDDGDLNGFENLKIAIKKALKTTDWERKEKLPKNWITQRNEFYKLLQSDTKKIDYNDFVTEMCKDNLLSPDTILGWLSDSGVVFYREGLFKNQIILDQQWAIDVVYTLFDRKKHYYRLKDAKGGFTKEDLKEFWENNNLAEQNLFLSFMISCEICYCTHYVKGEYIAPAFLPDKKEGESLADFWQGKIFDTEKYEFSFLHYGVIQSFIVRLNNFRTENISVESVWQYGISFKYNNLPASVEANLQEKTILVNVSQSTNQSLLNKIQNLIYKLDGKENIKRTFLSMSNIERKEDKNDTFINQLAEKVAEKLRPQFTDLQIGQELLIDETAKISSKQDSDSETLHRVEVTTKQTLENTEEIKQKLDEILSDFKTDFQTIITQNSGLELKIDDFEARITANLAQLDAKFEQVIAHFTGNLLTLNQQTIILELNSRITAPKTIRLDIMTQTYLYTAEYAWEMAKNTGTTSSLDYSITIFAFGKAVENEMFALMETFKIGESNIGTIKTYNFNTLVFQGLNISYIQKIVENSNEGEFKKEKDNATPPAPTGNILSIEMYSYSIRQVMQVYFLMK